MKIFSIRGRRLTTGALLLGLVLIVGLWLSPRLLRLEAVQAQVREALGRSIGGTVDIGEMTIAGGWWLRFAARDVRFNVPGRAEGDVPQMLVRPSLLWLLRGRVQVAELILVNPRLRFTADSGGDNGDFWAVAPALVSRPLPDIAIRGGSVAVAGPRPLQIDELVVSAAAGSGDLRVSCTSSLWQSLQATFYLDRSTLNGKGRVDLKGIRGDRLARWLGDAAAMVADGRFDLTLDVQTGPEGRIQARAESRFDFVALARGPGARLEDGRLSARFMATAAGIELHVDQLQTTAPQLALSGRMAIEKGAKEAVAITIEGRDLDPGPTGQVLIAAGVVPGIMEEVTRIIRAGRVPQIRVDIDSPSLEDFGHHARTRLDGQLVDGRVFVPGPRLEVEGVVASVQLEDGVLTASDLSAQRGQIRGTNGILAIGFHDHEPLLHVEMDVQAEAASLAEDLKALGPAAHGHWIDAFDHLVNPSGKVAGRLLIGDSLNDAHTRVVLEDIDMKSGLVHSPLPLRIKGGRLIWEQGRMEAQGLEVELGASALGAVGGTVEGSDPVRIDMHAGKGQIDAGQGAVLLMGLFGRPPGLEDDLRFEGRADVNGLKVSGPLSTPARWDITADLTARQLAAVNERLFARIGLATGRFVFQRSASGLRLQWNDARAEVLASALHGSGTYERRADQAKAEALIAGHVEKPLLEWLAALTGAGFLQDLRTPLGINQGRLVWQGAKQIEFQGRLQSYQGSQAHVVLSRSAAATALAIDLDDAVSKAKVALSVEEGRLGVDFDGLLLGPSIGAFFAKAEPCDSCRLEGRFKANLLRSKPQASLVQGRMAVRHLGFDAPHDLRIEALDLEGLGERVRVGNASGFWQGNPWTLNGELGANETGLTAILSVSGASWDWEPLSRLVAPKDRGQARLTLWGWPLQAAVKLDVNRLTMGRWVFGPVKADISASSNGVSALIHQADLCGISVKGKVSSGAQGLSLELDPFAFRQPFDSRCLGATHVHMDGTLDLDAQLRANGSPLSKTLQGAVALRCSNGRIQRFTLLAKVLAVINITEIVVGQLPDLFQQGLAFNQIQVKASVTDGRLAFNEIVMDAESFKLSGQGTMDLASSEVDLALSLAPLKTIDRVISKLPVAGDILQGTLVAIPVRVSGPLSDPAVSYLDVEDVGNNLLELMKRVFQYPFKLITP